MSPYTLSFVISSPSCFLRINSVKRNREMLGTAFEINAERCKSDSSTPLRSAQSDNVRTFLVGGGL
jgi:hypothetical protein